MNSIDDPTAIRILKAIAQARLKPALGEPKLAPELHDALVTISDGVQQAPISEGDLARAALALLSEDPEFAEPIRLMAGQAANRGGPQRYIEPASIALTTAVLLVLQTRGKFKRDHSGKWSFEIEKKSASDAAVKLVIERLLSFLGK